MEDKKQLDIALFRYKLIAPVLNETRGVRMKYFRSKSEQEFEVPHLGRKRYKVGTFKSWLNDYRNGGFDALKPKQRVDCGTSRKIDDTLGKIIQDKIDMYSDLSGSALYKMLICEGEMRADLMTEGTLRKYIKDNDLKPLRPGPIPRKKFEKEHINQLWIADCMHGPYIIDGRRKRKVFLIAIIDDCSRCIVGGQFFFHENSVSLQIVLKEAIGRFGQPKVLYTDNGAIFVSSNLQLACARLGIALVHSKPYDSPSRGKIERFFRTVRDKFLPFIDPSQIHSIEHLNRDFDQWLDKEYHKCFHYGIKTKPIDKWMDKVRQTPIKRVSQQQLDLAFYVSIKRKVKNDATVSVHSILYEVPHEFIGKNIELRYPQDKPHQLTIYENNKPLIMIKPVNPHENASNPAFGIHFYQKGDKDND
jgi:putative transposase